MHPGIEIIDELRADGPLRQGKLQGGVCIPGIPRSMISINAW